ncbi:MAG: hypothetical protein ACXWQ5_18490 [Ktedonobacterales bacterium]
MEGSLKRRLDCTRAFGGTAVAAKHYLITNNHQIKPSVLTQVKGNRGPRGYVGPQAATGHALKGDTGPQVPKGEAGAQGTQGPKGDTGSQKAPPSNAK